MKSAVKWTLTALTAPVDHDENCSLVDMDQVENCSLEVEKCSLVDLVNIDQVENCSMVNKGDP